jgi:acyl carrier protein
MTDTTTTTRVRDLIARELGIEPDRVTPETKFADLGMDSFDCIEVSQAFEEEFDTFLDDEANERIIISGTVGDMIEFADAWLRG